MTPTSKIRKFEISKTGAKMWADWDKAAEYPEDMERMVPEFVHETISFFATSSYEKIIVEDSEIEKVRAFILNEVVTQASGGGYGMKWQPIDTAPKDGTSVQIYNNDGHVYEAIYESGRWKFPSADQHGCGCCSGDWDRPTHWMPLPEPPGEDEKG